MEAEGFKRKIKLLKEESGKRDLINIRQRHDRERKEIEDVHLEELNCFNIEWDEKVADLHNSVNAMEEELAHRHEEQIVSQYLYSDSSKRRCASRSSTIR